MKKVISIALLIMVFILIPNVILAQEETNKKEFNTKKTEVNIAIANIFAKNNLYPYYYYDGSLVLPYYPYSDFGQPETKLIVGLKFHNPKGAVRLATEFNYSSRKFTEDGNSSNNSQVKSLGTGIYLGYEWHSTFSRINIFYGFDVSTNYSKATYENEINNEEYYTSAKEFAYGISPLVGVNCFITPHLSIGTEVKFTAEAYSGKTTNEYNGQEQSEQSTSGFRTQFGPLGFLSINIHF